MSALLLTSIKAETDAVMASGSFKSVSTSSCAPVWKLDGTRGVFLGEVGLGLIRGSMSTALLLEMLKPDLVILIGFAGAIVERLNLGDLLVAEDVFQHDSFRSRDSESVKHLTPGVSSLDKEAHNYPCIKLDKDLTDKLSKALVSSRRGTLASGSEFMGSNNRKRELALHQISPLAIDMEAAAVAKVCDLMAIPCGIIKVISDTLVLKEPTLKQFVDNMDESSKKITEVSKVVFDKVL